MKKYFLIGFVSVFLVGLMVANNVLAVEAIPEVPFVPEVPFSTPGQVLGSESFHFTMPLKMGLKGDEVVELQKFLNNAGYGLLATDGDFGSKTKTAVIAFQTANGLTADGVVGPMTRTALNK